MVICAVWATAQDEQPGRSITSEGFRANRPASSDAGAANRAAESASGPGKKTPAVLANPRRKYSFVSRVSASRQAGAAGRPSLALPSAALPSAPTPIAPASTKTPTPKLNNEELGVTFWRLRPVKDTDGDVPTFSVKVGDGTQQWAAERVRSSTRFKPGDRVRFTIESSRSGYLYIANREVYADGSTGEAEIIFPTLRTRSGDNRVAAGTLVEIPGSADSVPYFTIEQRSPNYAGEELIVVISPTELSNIEKSLRPQPISRESLDKWYEWETGSEIYDADDGEGIAFTRTEEIAVTSTSRSLTRDEPLPQTIYRVKTTKASPLFVIIRMEAAR